MENTLKQRYLAAKRKLFDSVYGKKLNPEQCRAVFTAKGPLLVLAGAGSGKTTVLVNRISYLIKYGNAYFSEDVPEYVNLEMTEALESAVNMPAEDIADILLDFITEPCPPWSCLAITFTNKAAKEIKERLKAAFNESDIPEGIWAGTFHSVCLRILRKFGDRLGYSSGFSIYGTSETKSLISKCMKELDIDEKRLAPRAVAHAISMAKDSLVPPSEYEISGDPRSKDIRDIYSLYQKRLKEYNAVDFDDIIMKTVELLEHQDDVREYYQNKFKYVLVDEYQDTNHAQFVLTKILSDKHGNIMVVGDDDQSIYRFRGATIENILDFDKTYPDANVVKLEQNYRSTETILAAANSVIKNNDDRHDKKLWCDKGEGEKITLRECSDQNEEGMYIISKIMHSVRSEGKKYSDFAILYRVNELSRTLETSFTKSGIPYRVLSGNKFYDRAEIKDMCAYLNVINSPYDSERLVRIINQPKRKIGQATVDAVSGIADTLGTSMYEVMKHASEYTALGKSADKLMEFVAMIERFKASELKPSELIMKVYTETGYESMLKAEGIEGEERMANVKELVSGAVEYEARCEEAEAEPTLAGYMDEINLISDVDKYDEEADAVVLMTIHSAKGLEFPTVFLAGMEDGIFPSHQSIGEKAEMSEERRLAYVAITRAKEKLYITYTRNRMMYGRTNYADLSTFIRCEVPENLIFKDMPRREPPRMSASYSGRGQASQYSSAERRVSSEFSRSAQISVTPTSEKSAKNFGLEIYKVGTRVNHAMFGNGTVQFAKDMHGDVLYEVKFDTGVTKKLMATFAKLQKI